MKPRAWSEARALCVCRLSVSGRERWKGMCVACTQRVREFVRFCFFDTGWMLPQQKTCASVRKHPHRSGAICRVRWSGDVYGARPQHVRIGTVQPLSRVVKIARRKILKWWHMRAFSGSVLEWCGRADAAAHSCRSSRPAAGRLPAGPRQQPGNSRDSSRLEAGQQPLEGRSAAAWSKRLLACGRTDAATRLPHAYVFRF